MADAFMDVDGICCRLSIGPEGVDDCIRLGLFTPLKRQGGVYFAVAELEKFEARFMSRRMVKRALSITDGQLTTWAGRGVLNMIHVGPFCYYEREGVVWIKEFLEVYMVRSAAARAYGIEVGLIDGAVERGAVAERRLGGLRYVARADVEKISGYTRAQVASKLGISPRDVSKLAEAGFLGDARLPNGRRHYSHEAIERFMKVANKIQAYADMKKRKGMKA